LPVFLPPLSIINVPGFADTSQSAKLSRANARRDRDLEGEWCRGQGGRAVVASVRGRIECLTQAWAFERNDRSADGRVAHWRTVAGDVVWRVAGAQWQPQLRDYAGAERLGERFPQPDCDVDIHRAAAAIAAELRRAP